jgi:hypothetical protein
MSRTRRDAIHQAGLLHGQVRRLEQRRQRQIEKADRAFRLDLLALVGMYEPWLTKLVQGALDAVPQDHELAAALRRARENPSESLTAPTTRADELTTETVEPLEEEALNDAATAEMLAMANHARWQQESPPPLPSQSNAPAEREYRYPEPGEPAIQLPDGRVVAAEP